MNYTPNAREKLAIVLNNFEMFGVQRTVRDALGYLLTRVSDNFDEKYGVSTELESAATEPLEPGLGDAVSIDNGHGYEPTQERVMRHILDYVRAHVDPTEFTFVDLGCGKGRAVLMASELPFREVIGVDIAPDLCKVAEQNVASYFRRSENGTGGKNGIAGKKGTTQRRSGGAPRLQSKVTITCADVTRYDFPETDLLVYMFNPFRGAVFRSALDRVAAFQRRTGRRAYIALSNPASEDQLESHPAFTKEYEFQVIWSGSSWNFWCCRG